MNSIPQIQPAEPDLIGDANVFDSIDNSLKPKQEQDQQDPNANVDESEEVNNIVNSIVNKGKTEQDEHDEEHNNEQPIDSFAQNKGEDTRPQTPLFNDIKARNEDDLSTDAPNSKIIA